MKRPRRYNTEEERQEGRRKSRDKWCASNPKGARANKLVQRYNDMDEKHGFGKGDLTAKWIVENIFTKPCAHCGKTGWDIIGCNRLDNSKPHTKDNVEPCCEECNNIMWGKEVAKKVYQYALDDRLVAVYISLREAARQTGFLLGEISKCCNGGTYRKGKWQRRETYKGYRWSFTQL